MRSDELKDLVTETLAPEKRQAGCKGDGGREHRLSEAAVMLAFASHLFRLGAARVTIHPDGMHGKQFDIGAWLKTNNFCLARSAGRTSYGGTYTKGNCVMEVSIKGGHGDVRTELDGRAIVAECKGGVINSSHNGVRSSLRSGLREAVGSLLERPAAEQNFAVVPDAPETRKFAKRLIARAESAGIGIALISRSGQVEFVGERKV